MLRAITFQSLDETLPVLSRGFPAMHRERWKAALKRLQDFGAASPTAHAGYLLQQKGRDVGVILAIPSSRPATAPASPPIVNLSSWYIDPEHRWRAPRMLQSVVHCSHTLYTDLTSTPPVREMIGRIGFRSWTEGTLLFALPLFALGSSRNAHVVALRDLASDAFSEPVQRLLSDHAALDCVVGALWDGQALQPLIFSRKISRGIQFARLIYAGDRGAVFANITAIARFLLRERAPLLVVSADRRERVPGSIFMSRMAPTFYKGPTAPAACDFAYSEFVFLQI